uniref:Putative secreted protein n=1 Tax=Anopheles triannulatus TaxID=58253 RepID=A0A2M4B2H8_9DIPT
MRAVRASKLLIADVFTVLLIDCSHLFPARYHHHLLAAEGVPCGVYVPPRIAIISSTCRVPVGLRTHAAIDCFFHTQLELVAPALINNSFATPPCRPSSARHAIVNRFLIRPELLLLASTSSNVGESEIYSWIAGRTISYGGVLAAWRVNPISLFSTI